MANRLIPFGDSSIDPNEFLNLAKSRGWGDPRGINPASIQEIKGNEYEGGTHASTYKVKEANGREHVVTRTGGQYVTDNELTGENTAKTPMGWSVWAGNIPGKRNTRVLYGYDDKGKFTGVNFEQDTRWYEDAAPLIAMTAMALTAGGAGAAIGGGVNSSLNLGLSTAGQTAIGNAAIGAGQAALTGQNPIKAIATSVIPGFLAGSVGGALAKAGLTGPAASVAGRAIAGGATSAALGGSFGGGALSSLVNSAGTAVGIPSGGTSLLSQMYRYGKANNATSAPATAQPRRQSTPTKWF